MCATWPPLGLSQIQTFGGVYSDELLIHAAPDIKAAGRRNHAARRESPIGALLRGFPVRPSATVAHASGVRQRLDCIVAAPAAVEPERVAELTESRWVCEVRAQICVISEASRANFNG